LKNWNSTISEASITIRDAIRAMDSNGFQICLFTGKDQKLIGTLTDGDVRRAILKGVSLESTAETIMNKNPTTGSESDSREDCLAIMKPKQLRHLPIINKNGQLVGLEIQDYLLEPAMKDNWVVLMAGGLGSRLGDLTLATPKPLLQVGSQPVLETTLRNLKANGFHNFYLSVNYKAEMIRDYFGDGSKWGVRIEYIQETERLGTAGSLSLIPEVPEHPVIVMNGDLLTKLSFEQLLEFHVKNGGQATLCVREYDFKVPYGVVKVDKHKLTGIEEKPTVRFFVNAGIYVLEPKTLHLIKRNSYYDMTSLFEKLLEQKELVATFPIREYWLDIGRIDDFERANSEFSNVFTETQGS